MSQAYQWLAMYGMRGPDRDRCVVAIIGRASDHIVQPPRTANALEHLWPICGARNLIADVKEATLPGARRKRHVTLRNLSHSRDSCGILDRDVCYAN